MIPDRSRRAPGREPAERSELRHHAIDPNVSAKVKGRPRADTKALQLVFPHRKGQPEPAIGDQRDYRLTGSQDLAKFGHPRRNHAGPGRDKLRLVELRSSVGEGGGGQRDLRVRERPLLGDGTRLHGSPLRPLQIEIGNRFRERGVALVELRAAVVASAG